MQDKYAVVGQPINHSLSPRIHKLFAEQTNQAMSYQAIAIEPSLFEQQLKVMLQSYKGLSVTLPFKAKAFALADHLSERAQLAGAVNTLWVNEGLLFADNTDGVGLVKDLCDNNLCPLQGKKILVLGAGGAVRGVLAPLLEQNPKSLQLANRTETKALELSEHFQHKGPISGTGFAEVQGEYDVIINGTSASLKGQLPPLPELKMNHQTVCYDMMYSTKPTLFNAWAKDQGAGLCLDGLGMLVEQGAKAFSLWRGVEPNTKAVIATIKMALLTESV